MISSRCQIISIKPSNVILMPTRLPTSGRVSRSFLHWHLVKYSKDWANLSALSIRNLGVLCQKTILTKEKIHFILPSYRLPSRHSSRVHKRHSDFYLLHTQHIRFVIQEKNGSKFVVGGHGMTQTWKTRSNYWKAMWKESIAKSTHGDGQILCLLLKSRSKMKAWLSMTQIWTLLNDLKLRLMTKIRCTNPSLLAWPFSIVNPAHSLRTLITIPSNAIPKQEHRTVL